MIFLYEYFSSHCFTFFLLLRFFSIFFLSPFLLFSVPRACVRAESIVTEGDISFVSIGTNDLTQLMYGFSRDDTVKFLVSEEIHVWICICCKDCQYSYFCISF